MASTFVLICGVSGGGKTTVGEALKSKHGFCHFDGDAWMYGLDPVKQAALIPTAEEMANCPESITRLRERFCTDYYLKLSAGEDPDFTAAQELYDAMAPEVLQVRASAPESRIVLSHAVLHRRFRDFLREKLGENLVIVDLCVSPEVLRARKLKRLEEQASEKGQSVEEFLMSYENPSLPPTFEERRDMLVDPGKAHQEERGEDEERMCVVRVETAEMTAGEVLLQVETFLGLN
uniref:Gluconokinase n=1 Tax=Chromera velia CCMP2878 TaxID=1169474 RepID=A0A0G4F9K7_9ALVE|eukprot:Cvel_15917.t1-p1 / transcript=Cvel_15917.t1 / gene=Cvel_15917 / organism=Chromera_velia_CCMP2878 / gene_product=hypothetical protein / transcript_product=hypothetical protein / location=Cvel_scaffold1203:36313-37011(-) / protein_length=233 / sequence_SO=supercontig / SO=protein_coding / is_pseudo=false